MTKKERAKVNGEVFTPEWLVEEMLDQLPEEMWEHNKTFLDPAGGDGNLIVGALKRKIEKGIDPTNALMTCYAVELEQDNRDKMVERLIEVAGDTPEHRAIVDANVVCANSLEYDWSLLGGPK